MKKCVFVILIILGLAAPLYGQYEIEESHDFARAGIWFGPIVPFPGSALSEALETQLGGGAFIRFNFPSTEFMTELHVSYQGYKAYDIATLDIIPFGAGVTYKLPIDFALEFFLRASVGAAHVSSLPSGKSNVLPMGNLGFEVSFATGAQANVGLRVDYLLVLESHLQPPAGVTNYTLTDGHFLNIGLMLNFDIAAK